MRPSLLDQLFAQPDADNATDDERDMADAARAQLLDDLWHMVGFLPDDEQLILRLALLGKHQVHIAEILHVSQSSVSYRLRKAHRRLRWLASSGYSAITGDTIARDLSGVPGFEPADIALLRAYFERQGSAVGRLFGYPPTSTLRRLTRLVRLLARVRGLEVYHRVFAAMLDDPHILQTWPGPGRCSAAVEKVSIAALLDDEPTPTPSRKPGASDS